MLSVSEAQEIVLKHARVLAPEIAPLSSPTLGLITAEDVISDVNMPPFDKAMMDGYAVRCADLSSGANELQVIEEVLAGQTPQKEVQQGQATRIMTGAPMPAGADAVVIIERCETLDDDRVKIIEQPKLHQNIAPRAQEVKRGEVVLPAGSQIRPQDFGLLSSVGKTAIRVHPAAKVSILTTGDEIVEPYLKPGPGQIRNSNGPMLSAQAFRANAVPKLLGIAKDNIEHLTSLIGEGLDADILLLSGGVSAGKVDLVPKVLQDLGVETQFHKVKMKPGKPVFFGTRDTTLVFGLPGNPVSSYVCFELFVRPAIRKLHGLTQPIVELLQGTLAEDFQYKSDRPTYYPVRLQWHEGQYRVYAIPWLGSPDLRALSQADAFVVIPAGEHQFKAGQILDVLPVEYL